MTEINLTQSHRYEQSCQSRAEGQRRRGTAPRTVAWWKPAMAVPGSASSGRVPQRGMPESQTGILQDPPEQRGRDNWVRIAHLCKHNSPVIYHEVKKVCREHLSPVGQEDGTGQVPCDATQDVDNGDTQPTSQLLYISQYGHLKYYWNQAVQNPGPHTHIHIHADTRTHTRKTDITMKTW